ncbi:MAG TPA: TerB family tellurite resistance protein [Nannocystaceae bacterium]|nr:TerB family tellurite resistance protein [Nannocystaceae bacterium]
MDVARVLMLDSAPDVHDARADGLVVAAQQRAENVDDGVLAALVDEPRLAESAAALAIYVLEATGVPTTELPADAPGIVMDVALVALAADRRPSLLFTGAPGDSLSDGRLGLAARGEWSSAGLGLVGFIAALRDALAQFPGWPAGCSAFSGALGNTLEGVAQDRRLGALGPTVAVRDAAEVAGVDMVALASAIVLGDRTTMLHPTESELACRLGSAVVGRARDVLAFAGGEGPLRPEELVARRFAVPTDVIRLSRPDVERCLRAIFAMELLDFVDLLCSLDAREPLRKTLARTVHGMLQLAGGVDRLALADVQKDAIMSELRAVAKLDGRITSDERALLRGMDAHLHAFGDLLARVEEDRVLDFEEFRQLRSTRQLILDDLLRIALADDVITDDERSLLVRVLELLPTLRPDAR